MALTRSEVMARIRSVETGPEVALRMALRRRGFTGYRKNWIARHPSGLRHCEIDIAFVGRGVAVFVDGCFWHGCPDCYRAPKTNSAFWREKMERNRQRDRTQTWYLTERSGWTVLRFWEHEDPDEAALRVEEALQLGDGLATEGAL